jgi:hypothetical protein
VVCFAVDGARDEWNVLAATVENVIPFCKDLAEIQDSTKTEPSSWEHNLHFQRMRDASTH